MLTFINLTHPIAYETVIISIGDSSIPEDKPVPLTPSKRTQSTTFSNSKGDKEDRKQPLGEFSVTIDNEDIKRIGPLRAG